MENAGRSLALITHSLFPDGRIIGVAGSGHNGGDAIVALRTLQAWGRDVAVVRASEQPLDHALLHGAALAEAGTDAIGSAAVVLDGILGTGSSGAPRAGAARMIRSINDAQRPVIAVDLPSGANPDTGAVYDDAVKATATVSFGYPKLGLLFHPARAQCGRMIAIDIAFPPLAEPNAQLITPAWAAARVPRRAADANKGTSGRLLLLAGSKGMAGAAVIAGGAAVRTGAGLVRIVSAADNREIIQRTVSEATFFDRDGDIDTQGTSALVAGPGMGASTEARAMLLQLLERLPGVPTLLDADALNVFAGAVATLTGLASERALLVTPHPKELSRLTGEAIETITAAPVDAAQRLADATGAVVLLKGQPSVVAAKGQPILINTVGSSDFAVAGMGDQLAGVIGALLAAGLDTRIAAAVGLYFSGRAGDLAQLGRSLTPNDVTNNIAAAFALAGATQSSLDFPFITFDQPARW